ncbi:hypothetical protein NKH77_18065 [Streptomyces sp. M19]
MREVSGLGDEAYVVTQDGDESTGAYVILAVREGWMTYESTWSEYVPSDSDDVSPSPATKVTRILKESAKETLSRLKDEG